MKLAISALLSVSTLASAMVFAEAPAKEAMCRACHGPAGAKPIAPNYPKLNGQNKGYLVSSLKAYKEGNRKGGLAAIMIGQAANLSDQEIEELAAYYAAQ